MSFRTPARRGAPERPAGYGVACRCGAVAAVCPWLSLSCCTTRHLAVSERDDPGPHTVGPHHEATHLLDARLVGTVPCCYVYVLAGRQVSTTAPPPSLG